MLQLTRGFPLAQCPEPSAATFTVVNAAPVTAPTAKVKGAKGASAVSRSTGNNNRETRFMGEPLHSSELVGLPILKDDSSDVTQGQLFTDSGLFPRNVPRA